MRWRPKGEPNHAKGRPFLVCQELYVRPFICATTTALPDKLSKTHFADEEIEVREIAELASGELWHP